MSKFKIIAIISVLFVSSQYAIDPNLIVGGPYDGQQITIGDQLYEQGEGEQKTVTYKAAIPTETAKGNNAIFTVICKATQGKFMPAPSELGHFISENQYCEVKRA